VIANAEPQAKLAAFRLRLAQASVSTPEMRSTVISDLLRDRLELTSLSGVPAPELEDCLTEIYGPGGSRAMWEVEFSEPLRVGLFVSLLSVLLADHHLRSVFFFCDLKSTLTAAFLAGEPWFVGDESAFNEARAKTLFGTSRLSVRGKEAAEWLLLKPKRRHLVPTLLENWLRPLHAEGDYCVGNELNPRKSALAPSRKRGPKLTKRTMVKQKMLLAIEQGETTVEMLSNEKEVVLACTYDCSRDTCRHAREEVLSEIVANLSASK
jgi:hypothetical protein